MDTNADGIGVLPPAIDDSGLDLDEIEVEPIREISLESDGLAMVLRNAIDAYRLTAEEFVANRRSCTDVQNEFVAVDGAWMNYSLTRAAELAEIKTRLQDPACRLLTLVGAGGMGKTRLALEGIRKPVPSGPKISTLSPALRAANDAVAIPTTLYNSSKP